LRSSAENCGGSNAVLIAPWGNESDAQFFSDPFSESVSFLELSGKVLGVKPVELDSRLTVQYSRFTIHGRRAPLDNHPIADKMIQRVSVPGVARRDIMHELRAIGISRLTLFPDLDSLSEDLKRFGREIDW